MHDSASSAEVAAISTLPRAASVHAKFTQVRVQVFPQESPRIYEFHRGELYRAQICGNRGLRSAKSSRCICIGLWAVNCMVESMTSCAFARRTKGVNMCNMQLIIIMKPPHHQKHAFTPNKTPPSYSYALHTENDENTSTLKKHPQDLLN